MSEPIKPFDSLSPAAFRDLDRLDRHSPQRSHGQSNEHLDGSLEGHDSVAFDLDDALPPRTTANLKNAVTRGATDESREDRVSILSVRRTREAKRIQSLTNSPNCAPDESPRSEASQTTRLPDRSLRPVRRARGVRGVHTDAWAVPASANWTRTRKTVRKVNRVSRSTDWALPF